MWELITGKAAVLEVRLLPEPPRREVAVLEVRRLPSSRSPSLVLEVRLVTRRVMEKEWKTRAQRRVRNALGVTTVT